ncbi:hypothetical protein ASPBRDRAFT_47357 [Aspergillus brasiliensis CBS 101740]|uniref:Ankyrin repeat protein n=1 Tax=Aspergillus brasiliensis (strain CBS 101740 / IMI 381727 / IBT 21946) TaxID=767769 RepID=A0A1L9U861_ASPBC|nr:hypothetical protein ASPBRDRAFT_47357 [Aspergillus brasiliensis CBS 101740]
MGKTPLVIYVCGAALLMQQEASIEAKDTYGYIPLHFAVRCRLWGYRDDATLRSLSVHVNHCCKFDIRENCKALGRAVWAVH